MLGGEEKSGKDSRGKSREQAVDSYFYDYGRDIGTDYWAIGGEYWSLIFCIPEETVRDSPKNFTRRKRK